MILKLGQSNDDAGAMAVLSRFVMDLTNFSMLIYFPGNLIHRITESRSTCFPPVVHKNIYYVMLHYSHIRSLFQCNPCYLLKNKKKFNISKATQVCLAQVW